MRSYEQPISALDYSNQAAVPDHADYFKQWKNDSAQVRSRLTCLLDLPYGSLPRETCDVFPAAGEGAPIFVFIHGGWWYFLDKSDFSYIAAPFVQRGAVVVNVNYPLAPGSRIDEIILSVRRATLWVYANAARFGGDPQNISVGGHSAGGHLSTLMAFTRWEDFKAPADLIKNNCAVSGVYDLIPILSTPHNERIGMSSATAAECSPIDHIVRNNVVHIVTVGESETTGFRWQHRQFVDGCSAQGVSLVDSSISGLHHFNVIDQLAIPGSSLFDRLWSRMVGSSSTR